MEMGWLLAAADVEMAEGLLDLRLARMAPPADERGLEWVGAMLIVGEEISVGMGDCSTAGL